MAALEIHQARNAAATLLAFVVVIAFLVIALNTPDTAPIVVTVAADLDASLLDTGDTAEVLP